MDHSLVNRKIPIMATATTIQATTKAQEGSRACNNPLAVAPVALTTLMLREEASEASSMAGSTVEGPEGTGRTEEVARGEAITWGG